MNDLNYAPIPQLKDITKAIFTKQSNVKSASKNWLLNNEKSYWFSRSAWSMYAIVKFRLLVNHSTQINVWLPDYFCNESTVAIRSLGVKLSFYPILSNGKPNLLVCKKMLNVEIPDIILYVNYFGESLFSKDLYTIAKNNNAWLIEDSAHCLKPGEGIGEHGDFIIYSPHKLLAIPDGGLLVIRQNGPNKITNEFLDEYSFDGLYDSVINMGKSSNFLQFKWLFKRLVHKFGLQFFHKQNKFKSDSAPRDLESLTSPKISWLSLKLLNNFLDLELEAMNRKNIEIEWQESLNNNKIFERKIIAISQINYIPYMAKVLSNECFNAEIIFALLQKSKIPASSWPDLAPEVLLRPDIHKTAINMRLTCIFLPVHSSINKKILKSKIRGC